MSEVRARGASSPTWCLHWAPLSGGVMACDGKTKRAEPLRSQGRVKDFLDLHIPAPTFEKRKNFILAKEGRSFGR